MSIAPFPDPSRRSFRIEPEPLRSRLLRVARSISTTLFWTLAIALGGVVTAAVFGMAAFLATATAP